MAGNMTWSNNHTTFFETINVVNTQTDGGLAVAIIVAVAFITWMTLRYFQKPVDEIFIYIGAFEFMIVSFLIVIQWVDFYWIMLPIMFIFAGIIIKKIGGD